MRLKTITTTLAVASAVIEFWASPIASAGKYSANVCVSSTSYGGTTTTRCSKPRVTCKSSTSFSGTTRTECR